MSEESIESKVNNYIESEDDLAEGYISSARNKLLILLLLILATIVVAIFSMTVNGRHLSFIEVLEVIYNHLCGVEYEIYTKEWFDDTYIWGNSLPRMLFTVVAAIGLAIAGASMQSLMNNPLADPYTVGCHPEPV